MKSTKQKKKNLYEYLGEIEDHRRREGRKHELRFLLLLIIMGVLQGACSNRAVADFIEKNRKDLIATFKPKNNWLPSRRTLDRTLQNVSFECLNKTFSKWVNSSVLKKKNSYISIDGKTIKGTGDGKGNFTGLVCAFASKQKQVLANIRTHHQKESELPAVEKLLKQLHLKKSDLYS